MGQEPYTRYALSAEALQVERSALHRALRWTFSIICVVYLLYFALVAAGHMGLPLVGDGPFAQSMEDIWPEMPRHVAFALRIQNRLISDWADAALYAVGAAILAAGLLSVAERLYWFLGVFVGVALLYALGDSISFAVLCIHNQQLLDAAVRHVVETRQSMTGTSYFATRVTLLDLGIRHAPHLLLAATLLARTVCRVGRVIDPTTASA